MATANTEIDDAMITQYMNVTGAEKTVAKNMLEAFDGNLEQAVNMFLEGGIGNSNNAPGASSSSNPYPVVDIIEEEDDSDGVRAPIPQQQAVLVEDQYHAIPYVSRRQQRRANTGSTVFDSCRDFKKETEEYEKQLQNGNPRNISRKKRLHELFRPPIDIMHHGDFQSARDFCTNKKKWLLVNIQNTSEFPCQILNRDIWSNKIVREILEANFVLWQENHDSDAGLHYATFYKINNYPHIAIIDPRTGERLVVWENLGMKPTANQFAELVTLFLSEQPNMNGSFEERPEENDTKESSSVIDLCEDDQLEAAIRASLDQQLTASNSEDNIKKKEEKEDNVLVPDTDSEDDDDDDSDCVISEPELKRRKKDENGWLIISAGERLVSRRGRRNSENLEDKTTVVESKTETANVEFKVEVELEPKTIIEEAKIMLRLPDGGRKQLIICLTSSLKELLDEVSKLGFPPSKYELIKSFPRQNISEIEQTKTLKEIGLHKQETLFVQDR